MIDLQQGDVQLFQTNDDGEIRVENGIVAMSGGLSTSVYLALFGGNEDDTGAQDDNRTWWGNLLETSPSAQYRSETQNLLQSLPITSSNLRRLDDAIRRDLRYLSTEDIASSVAVEITIPELNRVKIVISINAEGRESTFEFIANWKNQP